MAPTASKAKTNGNGHKTTRTRTTRTRAEVASAFEDISSEMSGRETEDPKTAAAKRARADEVRKVVGQLTPETVVQRISGITLDVSKVLAGVQQQLVSAVEDYNTTNEAVSLLKTELDELHKKDIAATALDQLVQDYEIQARDLEVAQQINMTNWEKENAERARAQKEFDVNLGKQRTREQEDYAYKTLQERKRQEDEFTEQLRVKQHENREKQEALEKTWAYREENLKAREQELVDLRAKVAAFPADLDKAVKQAEAIIGNSMKRQYETQIQLLTKDKETDARVAASEVKSLQDASTKQLQTITELQVQLDGARKQVETIAGKALDSASGRAALEQVQQVLKDQPKQGK